MEVLVVSIEHITGFPTTIRVRVAVQVSGREPCADPGITSVWVRVKGVAREAIPVDEGLYEVTITLRPQQVGEVITVTAEVLTGDGKRIKQSSLPLQSPTEPGPDPDPDPDPVQVQDQEQGRAGAWEALAMLGFLVGVISITAAALVALGVLG